MASDYAAIHEANKREYGNIARWGRDLLVNRYDSSAHFVFELLQNAEDALRRRNGWNGSREVRFELAPTYLRVTHYGNPFTIEDVKGVCGVGETTKDLTDIGRFGIGFKSVYAITDRPEVHSGNEDFAIENFAFPVATQPTSRASDQTEFILPLRIGEEDLFSIVADSLSKLGARTLLFLREIKEITWSVSGGPSGLFLKDTSEDPSNFCRQVTLIGERTGDSEVEETWLVFSREARAEAGDFVGFIEIAFLLRKGEKTKTWAVQRVDDSPLYAFFPTVLRTNLGFLVQGPYRTTPSRDNVPPRDPWNVKLVRETAALLLDALEELKARNLLDVEALQCLPIERTKFPEGSMFAPLFDAVRNALVSKPLLPRAIGGWTASKNARLARTQELRELFDAQQLKMLLEAPEEVHWLSGDITRDTASTLRNYLLYELNVKELTPELIAPQLTKPFLEAQPDEWILRLYEFLSGQPALVRQGRISNIPLVRVEGGTHVVAELNGQPQAFLPSEIRTDFPTVPKSVCNTVKAMDFLKLLGLTEPDAVDDIMRNVIPKYMQDTVKTDGEEYTADIQRILNAFSTQHQDKRKRLVVALKQAKFVMSIDAGDGSQHMSAPGDVYIATERLKELFAGVSGVMLVDNSYACLKGEDIRELLEACGAVRHLRPIENNSLSYEERSRLRIQAGHAETSRYNDKVTDWMLQGLVELLDTLPRLEASERQKRAGLLWEELSHLEDRRGKGVFTGEYTWTHYGSYRAIFDAAFVRRLNETEWVPDQNGDLQKPHLILFDSLGWPENPFLQSKILFKPPIIEQLAKEAGIEPGVLDLLKKLGVTSEAELKSRLGITEGPQQPEGKPAPETVDDALKNLLGDTPGPTPPVPESGGQDPVTSGGGKRGDGHGTGQVSRGGQGAGRDRQVNGASKGFGLQATKHTPGGTGGQSFISYVGVHPNQEETDPDGLDHQARMALEEAAIELILSRESEWRRTPAHNPGFDLYQGDEPGNATRWCEVKAMRGSLQERPVGLSRAQFEFAQEKGEAYWLYVVEHAYTNQARIVRIQNPAGKACTFTFDSGWRNIALIDSEEEIQEE